MSEITKFIGKKRSAKRKFRMTGHKFFATYPRVNERKEPYPITMEDWLDATKMTIMGFSHYLIAMEKHRDGTDHIHMILLFATKKNFTSSRCFDISIDGETHHGRYEHIRNLSACIKYCMKANNYITDILLDRSYDMTSGWEEITQLVVLGNTRRAEELLRLHYPKEYLCTNAVNNIRTLSLIEEGPKFMMTDFILPQAIWLWLMDQVEDKTLYVFGRSGVGKTESMITFMTKYVGRTLVANTIDDLRNLNSNDYKGLILDDFEDDFNELPRGTLIALLETRRSRSIRARYHDIRLPNDIARVILSNYPAFVILGDDEAIRRRIQEVEVKEMRRSPGPKKGKDRNILRAPKERLLPPKRQEEGFPAFINNRVIGGLRKAGYKSMEDLRDVSIEKISSIKGIGKKGMAQIKEAYEKTFNETLD